MNAFLAAILLAVAMVSRAGQAETPAALARWDGALDQARKGFVSHQPPAPYLDETVVVPKGRDEPGGDGARLRAILRQAREVQEGCESPCEAESDKLAYLRKVEEAGRALGLTRPELLQAKSNYAPNGIPRKRASREGVNPEAAGELLRESTVSEAQRRSMMSRADRAAEALRLDRRTESLGDGVSREGARAGATREQLEAAIRSYTDKPAAQSQHYATLKTAVPPKPVEKRRPPVVFEPPKRTVMERFALWVDDRVSPKTMQKVSDFSAGFGDAISFNATRWVRKKMGTQGFVNADATEYAAGGLTAVAVGLLMGAAGIFKPLSAGTQTISRWAPAIAENGAKMIKPGQFVMAGPGKGIPGVVNWLKAGGPELAYRHGAQYLKSPAVTKVAGKLLRYPIKEEGLIGGIVKGLIGQRVYTGPAVLL